MRLVRVEDEDNTSVTLGRFVLDDNVTTMCLDIELLEEDDIAFTVRLKTLVVEDVTTRLDMDPQKEDDTDFNGERFPLALWLNEDELLDDKLCEIVIRFTARKTTENIEPHPSQLLPVFPKIQRNDTIMRVVLRRRGTVRFTSKGEQLDESRPMLSDWLVVLPWLFCC